MVGQVNIETLHAPSIRKYSQGFDAMKTRVERGKEARIPNGKKPGFLAGFWRIFTIFRRYRKRDRRVAECQELRDDMAAAGIGLKTAWSLAGRPAVCGAIVGHVVEG